MVDMVELLDLMEPSKDALDVITVGRELRYLLCRASAVRI
jgi:hypothetical protein